MKKTVRLVSTGIIVSVLMISSVMPVYARGTRTIGYRGLEKNISAYLSGPTLSTDTVELDPKCHFFGSAACEKGNAFGNPCYWKARQYGDLALTATMTSASFGSDSSWNNIMSKSKMVEAGAILHVYEKSAEMYKYYEQANTRLYY